MNNLENKPKERSWVECVEIARLLIERGYASNVTVNELANKIFKKSQRDKKEIQTDENE